VVRAQSVVLLRNVVGQARRHLLQQWRHFQRRFGVRR
jgi:hypothetical protein